MYCNESVALTSRACSLLCIDWKKDSCVAGVAAVAIEDCEEDVTVTFEWKVDEGLADEAMGELEGDSSADVCESGFVWLKGVKEAVDSACNGLDFVDSRAEGDEARCVIVVVVPVVEIRVDGVAYDVELIVLANESL